MEELELPRDMLDKAELWGSFLFFCETFFPLVTGREFIISRPQGRESHHITIARALTKVSRGELTNLLINIQPGSGKSVILSMWVAWMMSRYPDSNFLYIAFSHDLASKHTAFIKRIMENAVYQATFGVKIKSDSKAKDHFTTTAGGIVRGFSSGGPVTGADAGFMCDGTRFTGAVICFPHDELVHTELGPMMIGDIVDKKLNVKVWSMNMATKHFELKEIEGWHQNPGSDVLKLTLSDGSSVRCTPNHKIWTDNRGWVEAKFLNKLDVLVSPSPDGSLRNTNKLSGFSLAYRRIIKNTKLFSCQRIKLAGLSSFGLIRDYVQGFSFSNIAAPNLINGFWSNIIGRRQRLRAQMAHNNSSDILCCEATISVPFADPQCSMKNGVLHVVGSRSITKVVGSIISRISIFVPNIRSIWSGANKAQSNKKMHIKGFCNPFSAKSNYKVIIARIFGKLSYKRFICSGRSMVPIINNSFLAPNLSKIGNTVKPFISRNIHPDFIENIGHFDKTYCITVKDNHNFFCGSSEDFYVLVSNCDDMTKPDDCSSDTMRANILKNYQETILQRPRGPHVPMICIAQRLHEDDICAHMLSGNDERKWTPIVLPSIDEAGNVLCPDVTSLHQLLQKQEKSPYVFASQYQQNPTAPGNSLFKREWFTILEEEPEFIQTFITIDTAETNRSYNDASVFSFWGLYKLETGDLALHWIDCWEERLEPKDLEQAFRSFWGDCMLHKSKPKMAAIEKKSTGVTLLSVLEGVRGLQLREVKRTKASGSKTDRFLELQPILASKLVSLPAYKKHTEPCIAQASKISANDTHRWDDRVDTLYDACRIALIDKTLYVDTIEDNDNALVGIAEAQQQRRRAMQGSTNNGYYR